MVVLYHYTNEKGKEGIKKSKTITKTVGGGFGDGVYFTSLSPDNAASMIVHNNRGVDRSLVDDIKRLRVEYYVQVTFTADDNRSLKQCPSNRDIWLYKGSDVDLTLFDYEIGKCSNFSAESMVSELEEFSSLVCS